MAEELAQVRSDIKAWERSFRAENGKDPSREDIKAVPEITAKYKLYKSLMKNKDAFVPSTSSSQAPVRPPVQPLFKTPTSSNSRSFFQSVSSLSTPVADDQSNPFLTDGPSSLRNSRRGSELVKPSTPVADDQSNPFLSPSKPSSSQPTRRPSQSQTRPSPYGPSISDPNFPNPFSSPVKKTKTTSQPDQDPNFLFAPSPSRLKSLLAANSLQSPSKRTQPVEFSNGITPRTKARKRLRGEEVEQTPKRPKRRGDSSSFTAGSDRMEQEEDEEEVLGPTPRKPKSGERGRGFKSLFGAEDDWVEPVPKETKETKEGQSKVEGEMGLGKMFRKRKVEPEPKERSRNGTSSGAPPVTPRKSNAIEQGTPGKSTPLKGAKLAFLSQLADEEDEPPIPTEDEEMNLDTVGSSPGMGVGKRHFQVEEDLVREIDWSDSDDSQADPAERTGSDEMDKERRNQKVKIEPYRLQLQRKVAAGLRDPRGDGRTFSRTLSRDHDHVHEDDDQDETTETTELSKLSIRSPEGDIIRKTMAYHERKAMAIFSTKAARELELQRKGIEIYTAGEGADGMGLDDEEQFGLNEVEADGDDDWDSEPEGWKTVGLGVEEDW